MLQLGARPNWINTSLEEDDAEVSQESKEFNIFCGKDANKKKEQAGAELYQAQVKLGLV